MEATKFKPASYPEKYMRPCITDLLRNAPDRDTLQAFYLAACRDLKATASTRRKWKKAFDLRVDALRASVIIQPPAPKAVKLIVP